MIVLTGLELDTPQKTCPYLPFWTGNITMYVHIIVVKELHGYIKGCLFGRSGEARELGQTVKLDMHIVGKSVFASGNLFFQAEFS